jgi:hypothetical protein
MNDIMANTSFEAAVREALEGNPKKTLPQLEALRARHGDLFDLDVVREGEARLRRTMSLLNHVEFLDEARARVHTPDGKTVEVSSFEAFWKALAQVEEPLEDRRAWERPIEDRLLPFRRADGTVEWKRAVAARALGELGGAGHFALALFLKELAVVVRSGDRARIEEFFDHLLTTDFLKEYGLFVLGARVGDVAYTRYLERFVRPRFVSGVLRTNLVLAAGLALPMIVEGNFSGRAFAVSLSSLGLSTAAVRAGVASIRWVHELRSARGAGTLGRLGLQAKRFARVGGWFYSVGELAVILYVADEIAERINEHLDREAAEDALVAATEEFQVAVSDPSVSKESLDGATDTFRSAWSDYRNFLYRPLQQDEVVLAGRLAKLAAKAKQLEDRRNAIVSRIAVLPALSRSVLRRFASIEDYAAERLRKDEEELSQDLDVYTDSYRRAREEHLRAVYEDGVRGTPLLAGVNSTDWLFGTGAEPYAGRRDVFARVGRSRIRSSLAEAVRSASPNRLEAYGDELALLDAARHALRTRGRSELARVIESGAERTSRAWVLDRRLIQKDSGVVDTHAGAAGRLAGAGR